MMYRKITAALLICVGCSSDTSGPPTVPASPAELSKTDADPSGIIAGAWTRLAVAVRDSGGNPLQDVGVVWVAQAGGGSLSDASTVTDAEGMARVFWTTGPSAGVLNEVEASVADRPGLSATFRTTTVEALPPYSMLHGMVAGTARDPAFAAVIDANGAVVPPSQLAYEVRPYCDRDSCPRKPATIEIDELGFLQYILDEGADSFVWPLSAGVTATHLDGTSIEGLTIAALYSSSYLGEITIVETERWLIALPPPWSDEVLFYHSNFFRTLDVGHEAQRELLGQTAEEARNATYPSRPMLPRSTLTAVVEDADGLSFCGFSSFPILITRGCFVGSAQVPAGTPGWGTILHEMGHQSTHRHGLLFVDVMGLSGTYVEGEADVLSMWSGHRMQGRAVRDHYAQYRTAGRERLEAWEASSAPYRDAGGETTFTGLHWRGVHATLVDQFGWDYLLRYARAWREDPYVRARVGLPVALDDMDTRASFVAAAVGAALRQDLLDRFRRDWRFPIDEDLYVDLYEHFFNAMDQPWD